MPPKKRSRRTARIIRTSSPDHHDARASTTPEARRTRSGRRFAAPSASSPVGTRGRKPRASRRPNLGPSPVEVGRKRKVFVVESEDSDQETGRARRRRRGNGPNTLTHISDQNNRQELAGEKDDFVFTGVGTARGPKVVNFPWDFSIPVSQLGKVDQHIECFAHVEDDDLKSVLKRVGCDAVVRKREQLIKLVLAFGPLIEGLPDSGRTAPNESEPLSHGADLDQSQHPAPTPAAALQVSQGPSGRSYNREQAQQEPAIPNHTDLIDWGTPDQGPAPPNNGQQNRTAVSPTSPAIRQSGEDAIPATTPGLTPDLPGQLDSDETQTGSPLSLSYLDRGLKGIQKLLAQQSQKISALQEDASLTIRHQRDMLEILGQISEKVETGSTKRTASSRPSTASAKPKISRQGRLKVGANLFTCT
ncbi:hypothetical protein PTTG_28922 [Puccinia triticina 1-1 BBBD Race 1]|uniref:Uncharacterized protein n=1 Tax=Puccinia triticina (isolate 1-1 / race 1 (BBBD)) TaxID=630390 RepID=A0A180GA10_PUCT1|nr:hypothetical protein PTTG_28922 [Puccinia triticina 1-1 BBBD Race 1]